MESVRRVKKIDLVNPGIHPMFAAMDTTEDEAMGLLTQMKKYKPRGVSKNGSCVHFPGDLCLNTVYKFLDYFRIKFICQIKKLFSYENYKESTSAANIELPESEVTAGRKFGTRGKYEQSTTERKRRK